MQGIQPTIEDRGSPFDATKISSLSVLERAKIAVHTLATLQDKNPIPVLDTISDSEYQDIGKTLKAVADPAATPQTLHRNMAQVYKYSKAGVKKLDTLLSTLDEELVNVAVRLRAYTTNKLLEETENPDPKVRIKALELLGKIKDVGLFTEKIEITHKTKSDAELEAEIQRKLEIFMGNAEVVDAEIATEAPAINAPTHSEPPEAPATPATPAITRPSDVEKLFD